MSAKLQIPVIESGNKFELLSQLNDVGRYGRNRVTFGLKVRHPRSDNVAALQKSIRVYIDGAVAEDGSGDNWIISGFAPDYNVAEAMGWLDKLLMSSRGHFHGFLNTRTRSGYIKPGALL